MDTSRPMKPLPDAVVAEMQRNADWLNKLVRLMGLGKPGVAQARKDIATTAARLEQVLLADEMAFPDAAKARRERQPGSDPARSAAVAGQEKADAERAGT